MEKQGGRVKKAVEDAIVNRRSEVEEEPTDDEEQQLEPIVPPAVQPPAVQPPVSEPVVEEPPVVIKPVAQELQPKSNGEESQRMTMNEYLAQQREQQIGHPDFGCTKELEPEVGFYVERPVQSDVVADDSAEDMDMSELEEEGFVVVPNGGAVPNKIDVEALLAREKQEQQQRFEQSLDESGFAVVPSDMASHGVEQPAASAPVIAPVIEKPMGEEGFYVERAKPAVETPQVAPKSDDDHIVVKVRENKVSQVSEEDIDMELYDPLRDLETYKKPYVSLLEDYQSPHKVSDAEIYDNKCRIQETLKYFGIPIVDIQATVGPTVTLYEIVQAQGVKISKVQGLEKDIAQSLRAQGIRIIAPIPGRGTIGIEVPNRDKQIVSMYSAICSEEFQHAKMELPVVIGRTIQNKNFTFDLAKLPHLLVAGATGQGKSVGLNAIITSLLYSKHPAQLKFVMIDPKMVEFSVYNKLERHFLAKMESEDEAIVTDPKKAVYVLNSLVEEMGRRLELCKMATARNIVEYNEKFTARRLNPNKGHRYLPYIVVIVDEFADLIMTAKEVEVPVMRLAQKARAVGIHLIIATQRPDVRVITGGIKANFPSRIAFRVIQMIDSRTIIDQPGANQLIGRGDMLFRPVGANKPNRIQGCFVSDEEVEAVVEFIKGNRSSDYSEEIQGEIERLSVSQKKGKGSAADEGDGGNEDDPMLKEAIRAVVEVGQASTSFLQRRLKLGYSRAARIMDQMEAKGVIGPFEGAKPRQILITMDELMEREASEE